MKVLDLFSGIGGFSLGLERAGFETVAFCEIDLFCRKVLNKHWPDVPIHEDIKELDGEQYAGAVDVVCGGFPCQPFSHAGNRAGADDDRALWPEMLRVIREVQPTWVIAENVIGFESMGLTDCESDLESNGFEVQTFDIPACGVGANHRRHRLWIVAHHLSELGRGDGPRTDSGWAKSGTEELQQKNRQAYAGDAEQGGGVGATTDTRCNTTGSHTKLDRDEAEWAQGKSESGNGGGLYAANTSSEGLQGLRGSERIQQEQPIQCEPIGWPTEPPVCGANDGIPNRVDRLRALGNAVVPQIPEAIGRGILAA